MDLIKIAEEAFATPKKEFDSFGPGDTVTVAYRIKEGNMWGDTITMAVLIKEIISLNLLIIQKFHPFSSWWRAS